jgi:ArsR family transcriptional regulator, cadmium/lead-responsive transcriptional repressor
VFAALADPTRRRVLALVGDEGPMSATQLAGRLPVTRQAVAKHLAALRDAGLVRAQRQGRATMFAVAPAPLTEAERWLAAAGARWDARLAALERRLTAQSELPR